MGLVFRPALRVVLGAVAVTRGRDRGYPSSLGEGKLIKERQVRICSVLSVVGR